MLLRHSFWGEKKQSFKYRRPSPVVAKIQVKSWLRAFVLSSSLCSSVGQFEKKGTRVWGNISKGSSVKITCCTEAIWNYWRASLSHCKELFIWETLCISSFYTVVVSTARMSVTLENENFLLKIKGEESQTDACCIHQRTHLFKSLTHFFLWYKCESFFFDLPLEVKTDGKGLFQSVFH